MNTHKLIYLSVAAVLLLILLAFSLPNSIQLMLIAAFLLFTSYLLLVKKQTSLLSIPISTPTSETGTNINILSGILALIAGTIILIVALYNLLYN
ncbi:hypothetical protein [Enterococcus caccae]|uniref:Uncharacterized protein n=1 Tax=Enterococcus caccae ATCC BAA-1240 TaxID=1158612 RepID=R3TUE9_9ENTE|nr:hypothetical protein [Enterococcus caccae]EOL45219.1 hypothetical protein UC7_02025 [Enterococcus caccae ATCC BAA-1240]EOT58626.1 hypothetical protein I580_02797 [Enterococcus caccae ATCC BAA-1240]